MNEKDDAELVKQANERFRSGDILGLPDLCADDIQWELDRHEGVTFSDRRSGTIHDELGVAAEVIDVRRPCAVY